MIEGKTTKLTPLQMLLADLDSLPITFYLTGSRAFGTSTDNSDHDFFVEEDSDLEDWLIKRGFVVEDISHYTDNYVVKVLKHPLNVHVQVVSDTKKKQKAQNILLLFLRGKVKSKSEMRFFWQGVLDIL